WRFPGSAWPSLRGALGSCGRCARSRSRQRRSRGADRPSGSSPRRPVERSCVSKGPPICRRWSRWAALPASNAEWPERFRGWRGARRLVLRLLQLGERFLRLLEVGIELQRRLVLGAGQGLVSLLLVDHAQTEMRVGEGRLVLGGCMRQVALEAFLAAVEPLSRERGRPAD